MTNRDRKPTNLDADQREEALRAIRDAQAIVERSRALRAEIRAQRRATFEAQFPSSETTSNDNNKPDTSE